MARRTNYLQLALDLRRGGWLIDDPEALMPVVNAFLQRGDIGSIQLDDYSVSEFQLSGGAPAPAKKDTKDPRVIVVPIHGTMTKYETCSSYGSVDIAAKILEYSHDDSVVGFVLDFDSGGGAANSVPPLTGAIAQVRAAGKPVIAHCDACFSAAYWVASQCDAVFLDNDLSQVGSIGAFAQFLDDREDKQTGYKVVTVYSTKSADKNRAYREALDGKPERLQKELDDLVDSFHAAVKAGRPKLKADAPGVMTGATFYPDPAISVGLADGRATLDECVENVFIRAEFK